MPTDGQAFSLVSIRNYIALKLDNCYSYLLASLVSIRNYIALKHTKEIIKTSFGLVSIRNYIALKLTMADRSDNTMFSIHTKLHRSKTPYVIFRVICLFSIHTKLHRSKTGAVKKDSVMSLVSIRNYIALKQRPGVVLKKIRLVSIRNYIALKQKVKSKGISSGLVSIRNYIALKQRQFRVDELYVFSIHTKLHRSKTKEENSLYTAAFSIHTKLHRSKTRQPGKESIW